MEAIEKGGWPRCGLDFRRRNHGESITVRLQIVVRGLCVVGCPTCRVYTWLLSWLGHAEESEATMGAALLSDLSKEDQYHQSISGSSYE